MSESLKFSLTHAFIQSAIVLPDLWYTPPWNIDPDLMLHHTSPKIQSAHYLFLSYILIDTFKHYNTLKYDEYFHHIMTFIGVSTSLSIVPHYIGYFCLANEFSTIFLHLRHYVKYKFLCKVLFLITFTIFRMLLNLYLLYWTVKHIGFGIPLIAQVISYSINVWWYRRILKIAFNYKK